MTIEKLVNMVFQIITDDNQIFTVHTEVGDGLTKVVVDEKPIEEPPMENEDDD